MSTRGHHGLLLGASAEDPHWSNVSALLHGNGTNGGTVFTDETGKTWTPSGDVQTSTSQYKFNGSSLYFDGAGDWLDAPSGSDFNFGTGDFTWECWAYFTAIGNRAVFSIDTNWTLYRSNVDELFLYDGTTNIISAGTISLNAWHFIQLIRSSGTMRIAVGGSTKGSVSHSANLTSNNLRVGSAANGTSNMAGYIAEVRITKGVGRANSLPAAPFPNS